MRKFVVGIMGPGDYADIKTIAKAHQLGQLVAQEHWVVLSGGRDSGVMKAVNEGAKQIEGSITVGILPSKESKVSPDVDIVIVTDMHNARNNINVLSSDVVVTCGTGGAGTVSEIALALKAEKTIIMLDADSMMQKFFAQLGGDKVIAVDSPEDVIVTIKRIWPRESNSQV